MKKLLLLITILATFSALSQTDSTKIIRRALKQPMSDSIRRNVSKFLKPPLTDTEREQKLNNSLKAIGYLITMENDTLLGPVRQPSPIEQTLVFYNWNGKIKFNINKVLGYYDGKYYYRTVDDGNGKFFAKIIIDGPLNLLSKNQSLLISDYIKNSDEIYYLKKANDSLAFEVSLSDFAISLSKYLSDYPELQKSIRRSKLRYKDIESIVKQYNAFISKH